MFAVTRFRYNEGFVMYREGSVSTSNTTICITRFLDQINFLQLTLR